LDRNGQRRRKPGCPFDLSQSGLDVERQQYRAAIPEKGFHMSTVDRHLAAPIASPAAPPQAVWLCANWGLLVAIASSEDMQDL
jgi:hypothetical protein